jgi:hypothetical protein
MYSVWHNYLYFILILYFKHNGMSPTNSSANVNSILEYIATP